MQIRVILLGVLRDKLVVEKRGRTEINVEVGRTLKGIAETLGLPDGTTCSVNGHFERDLEMAVCENDEITFFRPGAGG